MSDPGDAWFKASYEEFLMVEALRQKLATCEKERDELRQRVAAQDELLREMGEALEREEDAMQDECLPTTSRAVQKYKEWTK